MEHQNGFYWVVLSIVGAMGLCLKVIPVLPGASGKGVTDPYAYADARLAPYKVELAGVRSLTTDGNFRARIYRAENCPDPIYVLPLKRNSEGALILQAGLQSATSEVRFALGGQSHRRFPSFQYWWAQVLASFAIWDRDRTQPVVWAIAETSPCTKSIVIGKILSGA